MATIGHEKHLAYYKDVFDHDPPVEIIQTVSLVVRQPTLEYSEDRFELTTPVNPLRGIFLNLLAFLTPCVEENSIVIIYNCPHVVVDTLSRFFPDVEWRVVVEKIDPKRRSGKIKYTTESDAMIQNSILISLNRSPFYNKTLCDKYQPKHALLSFPMHFKDQKTDYLDGTICVPVYSDHYSFMFYLVPNRKWKTYDSDLLKSKAYSFHVDYRGRFYPTKYTIPGLDNCFDCAIETAICEMYLFGVRKIFPKSDTVNELIVSYTSALSR